MTLHRTNGTFLALGAAAALGLASSARGSAARYKGKVRSFYGEYASVFGPVVGVIEQAAERGVSTSEVLSLLGANRETRGAQIIPILMEYVSTGKQDLVVGPNLRRMFEITSIQNVPWDMIRMPYGGFVVELPDCDWELWSPDAGGVTAKVRWLIVRAVGPGKIEILALAPRGDLGTMKQLLRSGETPWLDSFLPLNIDPSTSMGVEDFIDSELVTSIDKLYGSDPRFWSRIESISDTYRKIARVVVNLSLYLQSEGAVLEQTAESVSNAMREAKLRQSLERLSTKRLSARAYRRQREKLESQLAKASGPVVSVVAPHVEAEQEEKESKDRRGVRGHWVRGHWRFQARKGPRYLIWIQPFYKPGKSSSRVTQKTQHLELDDE